MLTQVPAEQKSFLTFNGFFTNITLYKHVTDVHQGELVDFKMKVVRRHQTALFRQVHEAVRLQRISRNPGVRILNSRGEYNRCRLPRLQVADEFKDPNEQDGGAKYTLHDKQKKAKPNVDEDFRNRKDKLKVNDSTNDDGDQVNFQSNQTNNLKYTLNSNMAAQQTESKPNMVEAGEEIKQQPRRMYKYVASNFRKKFDVRK